MAWQDTMTIMMRVMVNDLGATVYTDDQLQQVLAVAAFQVEEEMVFSQSFVVDMVNILITPDPTSPATQDNSFINLSCLKAAAITDRGSAILAANRAIAVKDGSSSIDLRGPLKGWLELLQLGWNAAYEQAKDDYVMGKAPIAGAAVLGPFRTVLSSNNQNLFVYDDERYGNFPGVWNRGPYNPGIY